MGFCSECGHSFPAGIARCPLDGRDLVETMDPFLGNVLGGRYRLVERIGSGGMGHVYRARHVHMDREVAVKILTVDGTQDEGLDELRERFVREARAADMVRHRHIVEVYEVGQAGKRVSYMVMELLEGFTLDDFIEQSRVELHRIARIVRQICSVLGPTHAMGIVHRDLKPTNVFLTEGDGNPDYVKILDFGVAHLANEPGLTINGQVLGTPEYMSPEQAMGERPGPTSDLYALGCITYDMVAGHPPFHEGNIMEIMRQQISDPPTPLRDLIPQVPEAFQAIVMRLLAKDPADRYPDAYAVLRDLDQVFPAGEAPRRRRDSRLSFGTSGPLEAQGKPSVPPPSLASWKGFVTRSRRLEVEGRRRILYEVEELVGQLDSLVDMMEQISTVMEMKQDAHREEGRRIRHAIDKFAQSVSIKRGTLQDLRQEFDALAAEMSELDRQIAVHVVNLQVSGRIEIGARLDERLVASCADLGNLAHGWMEHNARLAGLRKKGQTLSKQIRDNEMQIDALRERLGSVLLEASAAIETEQARIDSLEEERSRIETRLCGLAVDIVRAA